MHFNLCSSQGLCTRSCSQNSLLFCLRATQRSYMAMASVARPPSSFSASQFQAVSSNSSLCCSQYTFLSPVLTSRSRSYVLVMRCAATEVPSTIPVTPSPSPSQRRIVGRGSKLIGCGSATPKRVISNDDLSKFVETSDEWISVRTGIRNRRVLSDGETVTSLAVESAKKALEMAKVDAKDIDLILLCTSSPDDLFGSAPQVQRELGCSKALAFDITAACSGFVLGLVTGTRFIKGGGFHNVLVIGADALSRYVDWTDKGTCILFGDGAGALLLQASSDDQDSLLGFDFHSDGHGQRHLHVRIGVEEGSSDGEGSNGAIHLPTKAMPACLKMNGREVFKFAVQCVPQAVEAALKEAGLLGQNLDWLLLHQANQRILDAVAEKLQVPSDRVISNLAHYGNTSAASIPLALDEAVRAGKVKPGDILGTAGFGAGLTWGSAIIKWG